MGMGPGEITKRRKRTSKGQSKPEGKRTWKWWDLTSSRKIFSVLTLSSDLFLLSTNGLGHWQILSPKTQKTSRNYGTFHKAGH